MGQLVDGQETARGRPGNCQVRAGLVPVECQGEPGDGRGTAQGMWPGGQPGGTQGSARQGPGEGW
eukprot:12227500-Alexandrium_andersonii.AAC.1